MIRQYLSIKERYPDAILFYRMGDFYEMFFEDAQRASRILEITLTSRNKKDPVPIPMCGVPFRAAQGYIARLLGNGLKVAVCDQIEDPATAKGLVKRDVVRVITPGMIVEDELLDPKSHNTILAAARREGTIGLCYLDISTGMFRITESSDESAIAEEVLRIAPSEILLPESTDSKPLPPHLEGIFEDRSISTLDSLYFEYERGRKRLLKMLGTLSLEGFGCEGLTAGVGAAGALLHYVDQTQKQGVGHLKRIEAYALDQYLMLDDVTFRNLEILSNLRGGTRAGTLMGILDKTVTAMGGRLLKEWLKYPLVEIPLIEERLDAVEKACGHIQTTAEIRESLKSVADLQRLVSKISMGHGNARDLSALRRSLKSMPAVAAQLSGLGAALFEFTHYGDDLAQLADHLEAAISDDPPPTIQEGGMIRPGYHQALDDLMDISREGKGYLARLEAREKESTGITSLKVRYNKVFGYYIEVSKTHQESVPAHYVRKQTLVNAERYITDELKTFEVKVLGAEDERIRLELKLFREICGQVVQNQQQIERLARFLSRLDALLALAVVAGRNNYSRPRLTTDGAIHLEDGRHPVVEKMIIGERFVPNTVSMDNEENQVLIITGPNMAGKSTVLRQVALVVIMAQMGSFVPARQATISVTDRIFTRIGALDNLASGQSTFMVEMQETANILNNATDKSLVIMDEIGRGTSTYDGFSIAWAAAVYLHDLEQKGVKTLFATHYHELTELARIKARVKNFNIAVKEWNDEIIFLRKLVDGGTNRSYGIQVARLAGVPEPVLADAKKILAAIENGDSHLGAAGSGRLATAGKPPGPVQLDLFRKPGDDLSQRIRRLDISRMTPLDALNTLNDLKEEALKKS